MMKNRNNRYFFEIFGKFNVSIDFITTDGDHKCDFLHDKFLNRKLFCENYIKEIPISDFLHSIKILRSNLI